MEERNALFGDKRGERVGSGFEVCKSAARRLLKPFVIVSVAVEDYALVLAYRFLYKLVQSRIEVRGFLKLVRKLTELLCDCGVQHDVGTGNGQRRAGHTEFELVSGERERGGAVAVRGVLRKSRQNVNADLHDILFLGVVRLVLLDRLEDSFKLFADEHRNDGGRRLVRTETVIVSGSRNGYAEQLLIIIDRLDHGDEEQKELRVLVGSVAGLEQVYTCVCRD